MCMKLLGCRVMATRAPFPNVVHLLSAYATSGRLSNNIIPAQQAMKFDILEHTVFVYALLLHALQP